LLAFPLLSSRADSKTAVWVSSFAKQLSFIPTATACDASKFQNNIPMLLGNLLQALEETQVCASPPTAIVGTDQHASQLQDPYRIWLHINEGATIAPVDFPVTTGEKLSHLSVPGLINGLVGSQGGIVDSTGALLNVDREESVLQKCRLSVEEVAGLAIVLRRSVQTELQLDQLRETPKRILNMLCPSSDPAKFETVRRRVHDTVVLGRGRKSEERQELPAIAIVAQVHVPDSEKFWKCRLCSNTDQGTFVLDRS